MPRFFVLLLVLGPCLGAQGHEAPHRRVERLRGAFAAAADLDSALALAAMERRLGHFERALSALIQLPETGQVALSRGLIHAAAGHHQRALHELGHAITRTPSADAYLARARSHVALGAPEAALADYAAACERRPNVAAYHERGVLLSELKSYQEMSRVANEALVRVGEALTLRRQLVKALENDHRFSRAAVAMWALTHARRRVGDLIHHAALLDSAGRPADAMLSRMHALDTARHRFARRRSPLTALLLSQALGALGEDTEAREVAAPFVFSLPAITALFGAG